MEETETPDVLLGSRGLAVFLDGGVPAVAREMEQTLIDKGLLDNNPDGRRKFCWLMADALCKGFIQ